MVAFRNFKGPVEAQFAKMQKNTLYRVDINKDELWNRYLDAYPEGTNKIFRTRREYDCSCCRNFIRNIGDVVSIVDGRLVSIWDINTCEPFQTVANALSSFVKQHVISDLFLSTERKVGVDKNIEHLADGGQLIWEHFSADIANKFVVSSKDIGTKLSQVRDRVHVFRRGLDTISMDAVNTVIDLITQDTLYRGAEHLKAVQEFKKCRVMYSKRGNSVEKHIFCWENIDKFPSVVTGIRNNLIGTLLVDLSEDKDINEAVKSFEYKAYGYMRTTSVVSKKQVEDAYQKIKDLGLESALERRHAVLADVSINDILFADRDVKPLISGNVFDQMLDQMPSGRKRKLDKVDKIPIEDFIKDILPKVSSMELKFENRHKANLCSLIAPTHPTSGNMFKWNNRMSWSYIGDAADSYIKERVKKAGGSVTGDIRCSLAWKNTDDLDFHMIEPGNCEIDFQSKGILSPSKGMLDVDANAGGNMTTTPVENITYESRRAMKKGKYTLFVHQFNRRNYSDYGFTVEIEVDGTIRTYSYDKMLDDKKRVDIATIEYDGDKITVTDILPSSESKVTYWGIETQSFHKVTLMTLSPNFWEGEGNKHYIFALKNCLSDEPIRGFFNEYLRSDLVQHRKVFEIVGAKTKVPVAPEQISGLGFSSTQRNSIFCTVSGSFNRTIEIIF